MGHLHLSFGGEWTIDKLECLKKYLIAYQNALKNQPFKKWYIDAFAGTGSVSKKNHSVIQTSTIEYMNGNDDKPIYVEGSTRIALSIAKPFDRYIFIEKEENQIPHLEELKKDFPLIASKIEVINDDCNKYLNGFIQKNNWKNVRAVMFLDPYGMEVKWETLKIIANSGAIDLWLLFPLGVAVNRMLTKDRSKINKIWVKQLNELFGNEEWKDIFYKTYSCLSMFGEEERHVKNCNFDDISNYFIDRLKTIFPTDGVAENPRPLYNKRNIPLYLFCFASSNHRGAKIAKGIAQYILKGN